MGFTAGCICDLAVLSLPRVGADRRRTNAGALSAYLHLDRTVGHGRIAGSEDASRFGMDPRCPRRTRGSFAWDCAGVGGAPRNLDPRSRGTASVSDHHLDRCSCAWRGSFALSGLERPHRQPHGRFTTGGGGEMVPRLSDMGDLPAGTWLGPGAKRILQAVSGGAIHVRGGIRRDAAVAAPSIL